MSIISVHNKTWALEWVNAGPHKASLFNIRKMAYKQILVSQLGQITSDNASIMQTLPAVGLWEIRQLLLVHDDVVLVDAAVHVNTDVPTVVLCKRHDMPVTHFANEDKTYKY